MRPPSSGRGVLPVGRLEGWPPVWTRTGVEPLRLDMSVGNEGTEDVCSE